MYIRIHFISYQSSKRDQLYILYLEVMIVLCYNIITYQIGFFKLKEGRCRVDTLFCSRAGRNASFGDAGPVVRKLLRRLLCPSLIHAPTVWRVILRVGGFVPFTDYRFCCSSIFLHMANSLVCSIRYSARPCRESGRALHNASF